MPDGVARGLAGERPFLLSYGGGHALIMIALARELDRRGIAYDLVGLTTAEMALRRAGLEPVPIEQVAAMAVAPERLAKGAELAPPATHPDITDAQTRAYFGIGYSDLARRFGEAEATRRVLGLGRKAFEPTTVFRDLLAELGSTVLVTTTSPRFELAAIKGARMAGIPSIAIGDMYLVAEQEWILDGDYADHLVVMSDEVARDLARAGPPRSRLHVLGNPAFDALAPQPSDRETRSRVRRELGLGDRRCIFWPLGGAADEVAGRMLLPPAEVAAFLDEVCSRDPSFTYLLRPHPNWPVKSLALRHGQLDPGLTLEECLLAADICCVEASTVGIQAVLQGLPTVCYNFADYVLYPGFGWAAAADSLEEMARILLEHRYFAPPAALGALVGEASSRVADLVTEVASAAPPSS